MKTIDKIWSKDDWLKYLELRHSKPIQLGLTRMQALALELDLLTLPMPVITVAGTNGKGSTVAALEAIYLAAGFTVATYTSPHLLQFNERIRVNNKSISDETLVAILEELHARPNSLQLTYFEMITLVALSYFKRVSPEVIILEVGLGGRLDATNIINADLAILTTVDFDHQAWLGDTREAIGFEKAGIFRPGQHVVYADTSPPSSVLARGMELGVSWLALHSEYNYQESGQDLLIQLPGGDRVCVSRPQINCKAAVAAVVASDCLRHLLPVNAAIWSQALAQVRLPGRLQLITGVVNTLLDVAHNPQAAELLASYLRARVKHGQIHAVFAALNDKDILGLVAPLQPLVSQWYLPELTGPRAIIASQLEESVMQNAVSCDKISKHSDPVSAYQAAMEAACSEDWVVVYGSFLTVAPVLALHD